MSTSEHGSSKSSSSVSDQQQCWCCYGVDQPTMRALPIIKSARATFNLRGRSHGEEWVWKPGFADCYPVPEYTTVCQQFNGAYDLPWQDVTFRLDQRPGGAPSDMILWWNAAWFVEFTYGARENDLCASSSFPRWIGPWIYRLQFSVSGTCEGWVRADYTAALWLANQNEGESFIDEADAGKLVLFDPCEDGLAIRIERAPDGPSSGLYGYCFDTGEMTVDIEFSIDQSKLGECYQA